MPTYCNDGDKIQMVPSVEGSVKDEIDGVPQ